MRTLTVVLVAIVLASGSIACHRADSEQTAATIKKAASDVPPWVERDAMSKRLWASERKFYQDREWAPAWIDGDDPTAQLDELLEVLRESDRHGLDPALYGYKELAAARDQADEAWIGATFDKERIPELDLRLTHAFLAYAADLLGLRASPRAIDRNWLAAPKKTDLVKALQQAVDDNRVRATLAALAPEHPQYKGLQAALARALASGDKGSDVAKLRMNLERWRWTPRDLGNRHILINVPSYQMQVVEDGSPVLAMRVIVGAPETPTPLFSDQMTYVVFSPYWNIPEKILREETLPRLVDDPEYLVRNNIEVIGASGEVVDTQSVDWDDEGATERLRFRQAPGPENALGLVKFIFPNHFNVYLHDTPGDALFNKETRTLSHGCIRVEKPVALAQYVLRDRTQWTPERIQAAMVSKQEQTVTLRDPIPVHIGYWTAWVEPDGSVTYVDDPYGLDQKQAAAQHARANSSTIAARASSPDRAARD